jgi:hypothetical protein
VTDKKIGAYDRKPWTAEASGQPKDESYSVLELYLDAAGTGDGTLSLAVDPKVDAEQGVVTLSSETAAPHVLGMAKHEPPPSAARIKAGE